MDIMSFTYNAFNGVAGSAMYDGIKQLFADDADYVEQLEQFARNNDRQRFELVFQTLLTSNPDLTQQLETLRDIGQSHTNSVDKVIN